MPIQLPGWLRCRCSRIAVAAVQQAGGNLHAMFLALLDLLASQQPVPVPILHPRFLSVLDPLPYSLSYRLLRRLGKLSLPGLRALVPNLHQLLILYYLSECRLCAALRAGCTFHLPKL